MMKNENKKVLKYDLHDKPPVAEWIILAIQHVFAMFGATVLVPILVNTIAGEEVLSIPVALVASGIGTLLYILCTKGKSPIYLGSSFAYIAPIAAAASGAGGSGGAFTGIMLVGVSYVLISLIVRAVGKAWIDKLLPPIVIGPMVMIIGLGLASSAVGQIGLNGDVFDWKGLVVAIVSFSVTILISTRAKGFLQVIPFLLGIVSGYIVAVILGMVDFTPVMEAGFFAMPNFKFPFVHYTPNFSAALSIVPIGIVTLAEHVGDLAVLGPIINRNLYKEPGLERTLLGDGVATFFAGMIGSADTTTYGENISVVGMTKVASVWVIGLAAIFAFVLGFLSKFTALIATIPNPVLGGVSILLFGFIASNGVQVLIQNQVDFTKHRNIIIASAMLVLGLGGAVLSLNFGEFSVSFSQMSLAAIVGIVLNQVIPDKE